MIYRVKIIKFREKVYKAVTNKDIWWFVHWVKEKSHLFSEFLIIFLLREIINEVLYYIIISQEKTEILKRYFFSEKLQVDLSDMKEIIYSSEMKLLL